MPALVTRTQLSLYVPDSLSVQLEAVRSHLDPVQRALIPAHVTLCREEELAIVGMNNLRSSLKSLLVRPLTLKFGPPEQFQGHGILLPCIEGEGEYRTLRQHVLGSNIVRGQTPHITLAHPRNPKTSNNVFSNATMISSGLVITFKRIQLIEQEGAVPWKVLEEYALFGAEYTDV